jgi:hypothetical protein
MSRDFVGYQPGPEDCWRGIILFGRNVATYKFALGSALLELQPHAGQLVKLEELAKPFAKHLCTHLRLAGTQSTSPNSRFLDACRRANMGEVTSEQLVDQAVRIGFKDVIDAFHVVGGGEVPKRFFTDERRGGGGIRITQSFSDLLGGRQGSSLPLEVDARWRLVETAWELGLSPALLSVGHDLKEESRFVVDANKRRRSITGSRDALNGYQKGHCFYCFDSISLRGTNPPDVDHFFPHCLKSVGMKGGDGVWNLVLACRRCNRGVQGKSNLVPSIKLLARLSARNEFLIKSHHPLRETLITQTGRSEAERRSFLSNFHRSAHAVLIHEWEPKTVREPLF